MDSRGLTFFRWGVSLAVPDLVITTSEVSYSPSWNRLKLLLPTVNLFQQPPPLLTTWEWGVATVDNSLYRLHCHRPGLEPTTLTMRGPNWSVPQCIRELSHIPMASQALWIRQCPWASWCGRWSTARMRMCGRQATYIPVSWHYRLRHSVPRTAPLSPAYCATQSRLKPLLFCIR
jgi:hypothetical protein